MPTPISPPHLCLLHRYRLGQVPGLIYVASPCYGGVVGDQLQGGDEIAGTGGMVQHQLDLVGDTFQGCEQLLGFSSGHLAALLSEPEGQEVEDGDRADEGLGGHDSDLWTGLQVEDGIGQTGDGTGNDVGNGD